MCPCWETALPSKGAVGAGWKTAAVIDNERDWAGLLLLLWKSEPEVFWIRHRWSLCLLGWEIITYIMAKGGSLWLLATGRQCPLHLWIYYYWIYSVFLQQTRAESSIKRNRVISFQVRLSWSPATTWGGSGKWWWWMTPCCGVQRPSSANFTYCVRSCCLSETQIKDVEERLLRLLWY